MRGVRFNCGDADLSQRHLLCKRQYNCGDADLSQRHLLCKRLYNCGDADLSQRHLLCKRLYNCGDTDLLTDTSSANANNGGDKPAAATAVPIRAAAPVTSSAYCACHTTRSRGHGGANPRRSSCHKLCALHLPHNKQPRPRRRHSAPQLLSQALRTAPATQQAAAATAAPIRAAAPVTSSACCNCHTTSSRGHGGANPRHSSCHKLFVLRLPRNK